MNRIIRSAAALGLVAIVCTSALTAVDRQTADRIAEQEKRVILEQLAQILPQQYDNPLLDDRFTFRDDRYFPNGQEVVAYRARYQGSPQAVVLKFSDTKKIFFVPLLVQVGLVLHHSVTQSFLDEHDSL